MLSRRDKLLVQPWEERRFKDHRSKVATAAPAIDARAPPARPHVALKLKKWQRERERRARVLRDNFSLLQRLAGLMRARRLDNRWDPPPPNFQNKVGLFYDAQTLSNRLSARLDDDSTDTYYANVKCYACEYKKMKNYKNCSPARQDSLPSIH